MLFSAVRRVRVPLSLRSPGRTLVQIFMIFCLLGPIRIFYFLFSPDCPRILSLKGCFVLSSLSFKRTLTLTLKAAIRFFRKQRWMQRALGSKDNFSQEFGLLKSHSAPVPGRGSRWHPGMPPALGVRGTYLFPGSFLPAKVCRCMAARLGWPGPWVWLGSHSSQACSLGGGSHCALAYAHGPQC